MKRSPMPPRRKPMKRTKLAAVSDKRKAERPTRTQIVADAVGKIGVCPLSPLGNCSGPLVGHELVKRSALKGAHLDRRLVVAVCRFHNGWIEDYPLEAQMSGVSIPRWVWDQHGDEALAEAARLRARLFTRQGTGPFWLAEP